MSVALFNKLVRRGLIENLVSLLMSVFPTFLPLSVIYGTPFNDKHLFVFPSNIPSVYLLHI